MSGQKDVAIRPCRQHVSTPQPERQTAVKIIVLQRATLRTGHTHC